MKFNLIIDKSKDEEITATVHSRSSLIDEIEALVLQSARKDSVTVYSEDEIKTLSFDEIECITVLDKKTFVISAKGEKFRIKMRLYEIEEILPSCFIKINKSSVANEKFIERFSVSFSGAVDAVFKSGYKEYVSRRCFAEIKRRYFNK